MEKYYTPTVEDFVWGLEYEIHWPKAGVWKKFSVNKYFDYQSVAQPGDDELSLYRVKYLDQEDIESLGWKFDGVKNLDYADTFHCCVNEQGWRMTIHKKAWEKAYWFQLHNCKEGNDIKVEEFRVRIRNKSELKRLLEMLLPNEES